MSRQAICEFAQRRGIKRPKRPKRGHMQNCSICQSLLRIAKRPHSDFISSRTIKEQLRIKKANWLYHMRILRDKGLISPTFGRLQSQKVERAYQLYFKKRLPVTTIGRQVGLKNFYQFIKVHRASGWMSPPLFKYDSKERMKAIARMNRKNREPIGRSFKTS